MLVKQTLPYCSLLPEELAKTARDAPAPFCPLLSLPIWS